MSHYRRSLTQGATFFFTVTLADRTSHLLVDEIDRFRLAYRTVHVKHAFETIAICVLPDHLHAIWQLPDGDADYGDRWRMIKRQFSIGFAPSPKRSASKVRSGKKESGNAGSGNTKYARTKTLKRMSITFISIR